MVDSLFFGGVAGRQEAGVAQVPVPPVSGATAVKPAAPPAERAHGSGQPSQAAIDAAVRHVSEFVQATQRTLNFSVDRASGDVVVKVIDQSTHEVIRQIPSEEMLVIAKRLRAATGVLVDEKA